MSAASKANQQFLRETIERQVKEKEKILSQFADLAFEHEALKVMYLRATKDYEGLLRLGYPPKS